MQLSIRSISHWVSISYVFLYLIFRPFIFRDEIKSVTLLNFIFISNREKIQRYRRNFQFREVKYKPLKVNINYDSNKQ